MICQDVLYEKVARTGVELDFVVVTNVGEYLPTLKRLLAKKTAGRGREGALAAGPAQGSIRRSRPR